MITKMVSFKFKNNIFKSKYFLMIILGFTLPLLLLIALYFINGLEKELLSLYDPSNSEEHASERDSKLRQLILHKIEHQNKKPTLV